MITTAASASSGTRAATPGAQDAVGAGKTRCLGEISAAVHYGDLMPEFLRQPHQRWDIVPAAEKDEAHRWCDPVQQNVGFSFRRRISLAQGLFRRGHLGEIIRQTGRRGLPFRPATHLLAGAKDERARCDASLAAINQGQCARPMLFSNPLRHLGQRPEATRENRLDENFNAAFAAQARAERHVVLIGGVVDRNLRLAGKNHGQPPGDHVPFQAPAAHRAGETSARTNEHPRSGPAVTRPRHLHHGRQRVREFGSGRPRAKNFKQFLHEAASQNKQQTDKRRTRTLGAVGKFPGRIIRHNH
jgi:hypothetical protein